MTNTYKNYLIQALNKTKQLLEVTGYRANLTRNKDQKISADEEDNLREIEAWVEDQIDFIEETIDWIIK